MGAGFSPVEAISIATLNGATYLGQQDKIGSVTVGKNADLVIIKGDPATSISDIELPRSPEAGLWDDATQVKTRRVGGLKVDRFPGVDVRVAAVPNNRILSRLMAG